MLLLLGLAACSGGGGSSPQSSAPTPTPAPAPTPAGTGSVGILLTDGPTDQFAEINATITEISLLGGGSPRVIFSGTATVNLLALESHSELFALADDVAPGTFNKIRLTLSALELVRRDAAGNVTARIRPPLPGNGKLDLNPRGSVRVVPGQTLLIELDLDMNKSIHFVNNGKELRFRPVIFVRILNDTAKSRLVRLSGIIRDLETEPRAFDLCAAMQDAPRLRIETAMHSGRREKCIEVLLDEATGVSGPNGAPIDFDALVEGDPATAVGHLRRNDDDDSSSGRGNGDDDDDDEDEDEDEDDEDGHDGSVRLDAVVIEAGKPGTFVQLNGTIDTALDTATDRFDFLVGAGQGFTPDTTLSALVQEGTRIFARDGTELDEAAIKVDVEATLDGVLQLSSTADDTLRTALIVVDTEADASTTLSGNILTLDAATRSFNMSTTAGDRCVRVPADADVFLITIANSGFTSERGEFSDLVAGQRVDVYGEQAVDGCVVADAVIAEVGAAPMPLPSP
jgi:hypothetical protein